MRAWSKTTTIHLQNFPTTTAMTTNTTHTPQLAAGPSPKLTDAEPHHTTIFPSTRATGIRIAELRAISPTLIWRDLHLDLAAHGDVKRRADLDQQQRSDDVKGEGVRLF
jgi:hypothetical protein